MPTVQLLNRPVPPGWKLTLRNCETVGPVDTERPCETQLGSSSVANILVVCCREVSQIPKVVRGAALRRKAIEHERLHCTAKRLIHIPDAVTLAVKQRARGTCLRRLQACGNATAATCAFFFRAAIPLACCVSKNNE